MRLHLLSLVTALAAAVSGEELTVTTIVGDPYMVEKNGNYEGFIKDLLDTISSDLKFTYRLQLVKDGKYGAAREDGTWNGMIGEVVRGEADMAAAALTITSNRERVVTFSKPFMNLGISLLMNKDDVYFRSPKEVTWFFLFLRPFTIPSWVIIIVAVIVAQLVGIFIRGFHPDCSRGEESAVDKFKRGAKTLYSTGTKCPTPLKTLFAFFASFLLLIVLFYVAGLFWLVRSDASPNRVRIGSVIDASKSPDLELGCIRSGSTQSFFKSSKFYQDIYAKMKWNPDNFVDSNDQGVSRVLAGGYGLFMESSTINYQTARKCNLIQVGKLLDSKSYGMALPKNSKWTDQVSSSILRMLEDGRMKALQDKWLSTTKPCRGRTIDVSANRASGGTGGFDVISRFTMAVLGPAFYLLFGIVVAVLLTVVDMLKKKPSEQNSAGNVPMNAMNEEREKLEQTAEA